MKVLTANRLTDGEAVWLAADESWSASIDDAVIASDKETEGWLSAAGDAACADNLVVDVNLIDIEQVDGQTVPIRLRERIRAAGPTNRSDLGKQAKHHAGRSD